MHSAPGENNLGWIKEAEIDPSVFNIGIAHGALEGETIDSEGLYFLMSRPELEAIPVDVWLIGHTHVPFRRSRTASRTPGAYSTLGLTSKRTSTAAALGSPS